MSIDQWLKLATAKLDKAGIGSARLDALILLEDSFAKERSFILTHPETSVSKTRLKRLNSRLKRRLAHEPMAYIRGYSEFYGRKFKVNKHVLEPRPESEPIISLLKTLELAPMVSIADVGTGSGCLGISAALELHSANIDLYDIDASALAVAKHNMVLHELRLKAYKRDLLRHSVRAYDIVLANLPYVPDRYKINRSASMEPSIAIFGGKDGLDIYRRLFEQLTKFNWKPKYILTEALPPQHDHLRDIASRAGFELVAADGFVQLFSFNPARPPQE